jgi:hypothetical protein
LAYEDKKYRSENAYPEAERRHPLDPLRWQLDQDGPATKGAGKNSGHDQKRSTEIGDRVQYKREREHMRDKKTHVASTVDGVNARVARRK